MKKIFGLASGFLPIIPLIIALAIVGGGFAGVLVVTDNFPKLNLRGVPLSPPSLNEQSLPQEKRLIEVWIKESDLNEYGDSKDTVYGGGTPLFNEATGERIDKYQYILRNHPAKPWRK